MKMRAVGRIVGATAAATFGVADYIAIRHAISNPADARSYLLALGATLFIAIFIADTVTGNHGTYQQNLVVNIGLQKTAGNSAIIILNSSENP